MMKVKIQLAGEVDGGSTGSSHNYNLASFRKYNI